ncbi:MAG: NAD(P)-binding domain-containing protein [Nitrososphaeraceae archaeon]|nr:NAD(P)-binding domain-containing protein [Nitrososphaeraceae archaeon]
MSAVYEKNDGTQNELKENVSAKFKEVRKLEPIHINKVLVIGLGQLGLPVARYVNERGLDVYGYDISSQAMERAEKSTGIKQATNFSGFDAYIICVSTHKQEDMFSPQIEGILSIVERLSKEAKDGALVSIESTIPLGTSKKVSEILNHRLHVVHAPHRWYALEEKEHGVNQLRVVGGVRDCCLRVAMQFYDGSSSKIDNINFVTAQERTDSTTTVMQVTTNGTLGIPMHPVPEVEIAELTKIIENAHRYLQIAFAEDLYLYCQGNNLSFSELRDSLNTKWNVNVLEPREGIGGHCLPKDTKMFLNSASSSKSSIRSKIIQAAIEVDEDYRRYRQSSNQQKIVIEEHNKPAVVTQPASAASAMA